MTRGPLLAVLLLSSCDRCSSPNPPKASAPDLAHAKSCDAGEKYCARFKECFAVDECCADSDCPARADKCYGRGFCSFGACAYEPVMCGANQACLGGACVASPIQFTVKPTQDRYKLKSDMFHNGTVKFRATLTNTSSQDVGVAAADIAVEVASLSREGVNIEPELTVTNWADDPWAELRRRRTRLSPAQSVEFEVFWIVTLSRGANEFDLTHYYFPTGPGVYRVRFRYHCDCANAPPGAMMFLGGVPSNEVSFVVEP